MVVVLLLSGCASMRDTTQKLPFACDVEPCTVRDMSNPKETAQAPGFLDIDRKAEATVLYSADSKYKKQILVGRVRWSESVLPNGLLALFGPTGIGLAAIGMVTDYFTGNMFELPTPKPVRFNEAPIKHNPERIVIAPILAENQLESDEAVVYVLEALRKRYPKAEVQVPEQFWRHFERAGWSSSAIPTDRWKLYELYAELKTPYVVSAKVLRNSQKEREVSFAVNDVFRQQIVSSDKAEYQSRYEKGEKMVWAKAKLVELIPNAVSLSNVNTNTSGYARPANQNTDFSVASSESVYRSYSLSGSSEKYKARNDWSLSVANLDPDLGRRFSFVFRWATDGTLRKSSAYVFENKSITRFAGFENGQVSPFSYEYTDEIRASLNQYYFGASIGPEVGVAGFLGYLYMNVMTGAELMYADIPSKGKSLTEVYSPMSVNLGHKFKIAENFQFGWGVNMRAIPEWVTSKVMTAAVGEEIKGSLGYEMRTVVGLSYLFPEMTTLGRSQVRKFVSSESP